MTSSKYSFMRLESFYNKIYARSNRTTEASCHVSEHWLPKRSCLESNSPDYPKAAHILTAQNTWTLCHAGEWTLPSICQGVNPCAYVDSNCPYLGLTSSLRMPQVQHKLRVTSALVMMQIGCKLGSVCTELSSLRCTIHRSAIYVSYANIDVQLYTCDHDYHSSPMLRKQTE